MRYNRRRISELRTGRIHKRKISEIARNFSDIDNSGDIRGAQEEVMDNAYLTIDDEGYDASTPEDISYDDMKKILKNGLVKSLKLRGLTMSKKEINTWVDENIDDFIDTAEEQKDIEESSHIHKSSLTERQVIRKIARIIRESEDSNNVEYVLGEVAGDFDPEQLFQDSSDLSDMITSAEEDGDPSEHTITGNDLRAEIARGIKIEADITHNTKVSISQAEKYVDEVYDRVARALKSAGVIIDDGTGYYFS